MLPRPAKVSAPSCFPLSPNRPSPLSIAIQKAGSCEKARTAQGRGRYFLRLALQGKVLAAAVQQLAQTPRLLEVQRLVGKLWGEPLPTGGGEQNSSVINGGVSLFQFYDPVSSILGNEDLLGRTVAPLKRDVT